MKVRTLIVLCITIFLTSSFTQEVDGRGSSLKKVIKKMKAEPGLYGELKTSEGSIYVRFEHEYAPLTVANFIGLAEGRIKNIAKDSGEAYFDSTIFHRVINNFMIQGGDPMGTGMGGPGYKFKNEVHPKLKHDTSGILSMANAGPNTNGSQFFITHKATPWLDGSYNIFGKVIKGQEVVDSIGKVKVDARNNHRPYETVYLLEVNIYRHGKEFKNYDPYTEFHRLKD